MIKMLNIYTGDFKDDCIVNIDGYFNRNKRRDWFNNPIVKRIIKNIDNTIAVKDEYLESPVFGGMSPVGLSRGCKAVIMMETLDGKNIYATRCGDNCVPDILEIASRKDVIITLHHPMKFPKDGFTATMVETEKIIHTQKEFVFEYYNLND